MRPPYNTPDSLVAAAASAIGALRGEWIQQMLDSLRRASRSRASYTVLLASLAAWPAFAATITVTTLDDEINEDCDCSLREAIKAANQNRTVDKCVRVGGGLDDVIEFAPGILPGAIQLQAQLGQLFVTKALELRGPGRDQLVIDGGGATRAMAFHEAGDCVVSDLTIQGGNAGSGRGGAILSTGNSTVPFSLAIRDCRIRDCEGASGGGVSSAGDLEILDSVISSSTATTAGGGVHSSGNLTVRDSYLCSNEASLGGGIYATQSTSNKSVTIDNCYFWKNEAESGGGVAWGAVSTASLTKSTLLNNKATSGQGGALVGSGLNGQVTAYTLRGNYICSNSATNSGGAVAFTGAVVGPGPVVVDKCTFAGNTAGSDGGALTTSRPTRPTITDSRFCANRAGRRGGAMYLERGATSIANCTVYVNLATGLGGGNGIYNDDGTPLSPVTPIDKSVIWFNDVVTRGRIEYDCSAVEDCKLDETQLGSCEAGDDTFTPPDTYPPQFATTQCGMLGGAGGSGSNILLGILGCIAGRAPETSCPTCDVDRPVSIRETSWGRVKSRYRR